MGHDSLNRIGRQILQSEVPLSIQDNTTTVIVQRRREIQEFSRTTDQVRKFVLRPVKVSVKDGLYHSAVYRKLLPQELYGK